MTDGKGVDTGNYKRRQQIALVEELALKEAVNLL
jgi:hypothetical protein